jgi:imidazolonepropionase-like amidohydrolase
MTVLPGLFNVHVHLGLPLPFPERRMDPCTPGYRVMLNYRRALEAILTGTTSLRVVGETFFTDIDVREAINRGLLPGPRITRAGHALIATGGHGHNSVGCLEADGPDGFRRAAREQLRAGADLIKICLTGGIGTPREQAADKQMTDDEARAVVDVAHSAGKRVASHTGGNGPIRDAVRLGVDCIEHGDSFSGRHCGLDGAGGDVSRPHAVRDPGTRLPAAPRRPGVDAHQGQGCRRRASGIDQARAAASSRT